jgi:hypothetical protein
LGVEWGNKIVKGRKTEKGTLIMGKFLLWATGPSPAEDPYKPCGTCLLK